jgi:hypothetical protein
MLNTKRGAMRKKTKTKFTGFFMSQSDLEKLWKLSERYDNNNSLTMRVLIQEAYKKLEKETNVR